MSSILNQQQTLAKLRAELKGREGRKYFNCRKFGHLVLWEPQAEKSLLCI